MKRINFFTCVRCLKTGHVLNLDKVVICGRHDTKIFVDGELKFHYMPPANLEKELEQVEHERMVKRVIELENKKKALEAEGEEVKPFMARPLSSVLEELPEADVVEDIFEGTEVVE